MTQNIRLKSGELLQVRKIPAKHRVEYLAKSLEDEERFYVVHALDQATANHRGYYESFGLYIGDSNRMEEANVTRVDRLRGVFGGDIINYILNEKEGRLGMKVKAPKDTYDGRVRDLELLSSDDFEVVSVN